MLTGNTAFNFACKSSLRLYSAILRKEPQFKEEIFQFSSHECIDFIKQCRCKDQEQRPSVHEMLRHPWLNQVEDESLLRESSFVDEKLRNSSPFKDSTLDGQNNGDFPKLLL